MKITYDHSADAMYIQLKDDLCVTTKPLSDTFILDLNEGDEVIGIELLAVRQSGIDPLALQFVQYTIDHQPEMPDPTEIERRRLEIAQARKRKHEKQTQI